MDLLKNIIGFMVFTAVAIMIVWGFAPSRQAETVSCYINRDTGVVYGAKVNNNKMYC